MCENNIRENKFIPTYSGFKPGFSVKSFPIRLSMNKLTIHIQDEVTRSMLFANDIVQLIN